MTTSIGVAVAVPGTTSATDLLRDADVALYRAKRRGKDRWTVFSSDTDGVARGRVDQEVRLRQAIARRELRLAYQPQIDLASGRLAGVEALVRWEHPEQGLLPPDAFVPLAEETGLILAIGSWALEEACRQARDWGDGPGPALSVSVNLSARQFQQRELVEEVARTLDLSGLSPSCLKLEITESAMMADADDAATTLHRLKALGVQIAIDDFGTGYASLDYLRRFPLDQLKIDRAFIAGLGRDDGDTAIVRAVVGLAHALGLDVVVEGVENTIQLERLRGLGCEQGQGFYFGRPVPAESIAGALRRAAGGDGGRSLDDRDAVTVGLPAAFGTAGA